MTGFSFFAVRALMRLPPHMTSVVCKVILLVLSYLVVRYDVLVENSSESFHSESFRDFFREMIRLVIVGLLVDNDTTLKDFYRNSLKIFFVFLRTV